MEIAIVLFDLIFQLRNCLRIFFILGVWRRRRAGGGCGGRRNGRGILSGRAGGRLRLRLWRTRYSELLSGGALHIPLFYIQSFVSDHLGGFRRSFLLLARPASPFYHVRTIPRL